MVASVLARAIQELHAQNGSQASASVIKLLRASRSLQDASAASASVTGAAPLAAAARCYTSNAASAAPPSAAAVNIPAAQPQRPRRPAPAAPLAGAAAWAGAGAQQLAWGVRRMATEELRVIHADLSEGQFHKVADTALDALQERLEAFIEDLDVDGGDVEYSSGVLTVRLGRHGTYVINKQTPNRQIWLSSPVSGPFRYDYAGANHWVYARDGREMHEQLQAELRQLLGSAPDLAAPPGH